MILFRSNIINFVILTKFLWNIIHVNLWLLYILHENVWLFDDSSDLFLLNSCLYVKNLTVKHKILTYQINAFFPKFTVNIILIFK